MLSVSEWCWGSVFSSCPDLQPVSPDGRALEPQLVSPPLSLTNRINHLIQVCAGKPIKCISQNIPRYLYVKARRPSAVREICMPLSQMNGSSLYLQSDGFSIFRTDITRDSIRWREMIERCGAGGREGGVGVVNISWKNREEGRLIEQVK